MKKEYLVKLIKEIRAGRFDDWAGDYTDDLHEATGKNVSTETALCAVIDFLESREIELDEKLCETCRTGHNGQRCKDENCSCGLCKDEKLCPHCAKSESQCEDATDCDCPNAKDGNHEPECR